MKNKFVYAVSFVILAWVFAAGAARAATITVNTLVDENNTNAAACSLREAINNANNDNTASGVGCVAGSGTDSIVISVNGTITPASVLPAITTSMSITGNGAGLLTISGSDARQVFVIDGATVSINNLTAANGFDSVQGGAIYNSGTTTLLGVVVTNSRANQGGGVENDGVMIVNNSIISNNQSNIFGGGLVNYGTLTVSGSTISGNLTNGDSGGIANNSALTITDSIFTGNNAPFANSIGHSGSSLSVTRSTFSGNLAGSVISIDSAAVSNISNSTFFNNGETAIQAYTSLNLTNCTISGNRSFEGAIRLSGGSATLVNNIVAGNTNNAGTSQSDIRLFGGSVNTAGSFNNIIGTGGPGGLTNGVNGNQTNVPLANIRLLPLGNYGGAVQTMPIRTNSPARDAGRNTGAPATDARGYNRPQGGTVDIGAFEIQTNSVVTNTLNTGAGSLRNVVAAVPANEIVQFETPLFYNSPQTISLSAGQIAIGKNLTIYGNGANLLNVRNTAAAGTTSRVFLISGDFAVNLTGLTVSGGNLTGNTGGAGGGDGGGIYDDGGDLTLNGVVVDGNTATFRAGGIGGANGSLTMLNSAVVNNVLTTTILGGAGGLYALNQTVVLTNSTFSGNRVTGGVFHGGGVLLAGSANNATVTGCTIANNSIVDSTGAGGFVSGNGTTTMRNSIVASNANNATLPDIDGAFVSGGFNLIGNRGSATGFNQPTDQTGTSALFENADADDFAPAAVLEPRLLILRNNGGTVPTHALNAGSPAIDKGNSFGTTTDARGSTRPIDLVGYTNAAGGNGADIGAFESQLAPTAAHVSISGRVLTAGGGLVNATVYLTDSQGVSQTAKTSSFGNYLFESVRAGETYIIVVVSKRYQFAPQVLSVSEGIADLDFVATE